MSNLNIDVIACVDALCVYFKSKNIRGENLQNELKKIKEKLFPMNDSEKIKYITELLEPLIKEGKIYNHIFCKAILMSVSKWIDALDNRINNTTYL